MTRLLAYLVCVAGFVWLGFESVRFRQEVRDSLQTAYAQMHQVIPDHATDAGKVLNGYYEEVYAKQPSIFWPAGLLLAGATALLLLRGNASPSFAENRGSAGSIDRSKRPGVPPSVS